MTDLQTAMASREAHAPATVVTALVEMLGRCGVTESFGVSGGAMAALWDALSSSALGVRHFRHENGAAFAAVEASLASGRPTLLFTTTGPGLTNALTGIVTAREERARVIVVSAHSSAAARGRFPIQETSRHTLPAALYEAGRLFHFACVVDDPTQLCAIERELTTGLVRRTGYVAHLALDTAAQREPAIATRRAPVTVPVPAETPTLARLAAGVEALNDGPFAIWVGWGARDAADEVAAVAHRMRAPVMCSPRGKGIFPEDDALFVGVTGLAGHASVMQYLETHAPCRILVLGSRMGEGTSFWDRRFVPPQGFVHVDADAAVPGVAFPDAVTLALIGDVGATLRAMLPGLRAADDAPLPELPRPHIERLARRRDGLVRPEALMDALQEWVVDGSDATVMAESGHSFLWATHRLRFAQPHRYRLSTNTGSMGHFAAGVIGAALATGRRAVAVVGDGAMLMTNEINTAVKFRAPVVWVVLNDGRYGMCAQGMDALGLTADATIPQVDFALFARAQGARGIRVEHETTLDGALAEAMQTDGPCVVDVRIDPTSLAPASRRNAALAARLTTSRERTFPQA